MAKIMQILGGIAGALTLLVGIKISIGQLLPQSVTDSANAQFAKVADFVFNVDCDLEGEWKCVGPGCQVPPSQAPRIERFGGGYRLTNERDQRQGTNTASAISVGPRMLFVPAWDAAKGGMFIRASSDCRTLEPVGSNGTKLELVKRHIK